MKEREKEKWSSIDYRFMTYESDTEEDVVLQHKLVWRSEGTVLFMFFVTFGLQQKLLFQTKYSS